MGTIPPSNTWTPVDPCQSSPSAPSIAYNVVITGVPASINSIANNAYSWGITLNDGESPPNLTIDHYDSTGVLINHPMVISGVDGSTAFNDPVWLPADPTQPLQAATKQYVDDHASVPGPQGPPGPGAQSTTIMGSFTHQATTALPPNGFIPANWDAAGSPPTAIQMQLGQSLLHTPDEHLWVWVGANSSTGWIDLGVSQGPQGPQGPQGVQGIPGPSGPQGVQGAAGPQGAPGQTAIIVGSFSNQPTSALPANGLIPAGWDAPGVPPAALQMQSGQGLVDTRTGYVWLWVGSAIVTSGWTNLGGVQGPPGPQGLQGAAGPQGAAGSQGAPGTVGPAGPAGSTGAQGPQGPVGPASTVPGPAGPTGPTGATGPTGPTGPQGLIAEAPTDGQLYSRKGSTASWVVSAGGLGEAPNDGTLYGRKSAAWTHLTHADITDWATSISQPATVAPLMDGTAAVGTSALYARQDHVHPHDSTIPVVSTTTPIMDGTAAIGSSGTWADGAHVHPTDTSRYAASNPSGYQTAAQVSAAIPAASTTNPSMDGLVTPGTGTTWARADHVHPTNTALAPIASPTFTGTVTIPAGASISGYATTAALSGYLSNTAGGTVSGPVDLKVQAVTAAASTTINRANGENVTLTLGVSITTLTISGWPASGFTGKVRLVIVSSGAFTIAWPTGTKWAGGVAPTLTSSGTDIVLLMTDNAGTTIYGSVVGQGYA